MQNVIKIEPVERKRTKIVIGLSGMQGSGKTRTALNLAYGLANYQPSKIGVLDTENMRAALDSNVFEKDKNHPSKEKWLIANLDAPYSPERFGAAIAQFAETGIEVLIIDGASPEWDGYGGVLSIAEESGRNDYGKWNTPKGRHKKHFINAILHAPFHIIITFRAKEKLKQQGKQVISEGLVPIWEKSMGFDLTLWMEMDEAGMIHKDTKTHEDVKAITSKKGRLTAEDGVALREWISKGVAPDPTVEKAFNYLRSLADNGVSAFDAGWGRCPDAVKKILEGDGRYAMLVEKAKAISENEEAPEEPRQEEINPDDIV